MPKLISGKNDLRTWCMENNRLELLEEWDYDSNLLTPSEVFPKSEKVCFWKCKNGNHSYPAPIRFRTVLGTGCCFCSGKKVLAGFNDLKTWCNSNGFEYLIEEWDYENNERDISEYTHASHHRALWVCRKGHHFDSLISDRTSSKRAGCPYCTGRRVLIGENDLETWCIKNAREDLLVDWAQDYNGGKRPADYSYGSNTTVYWRCNRCNHIWKKQIDQRTLRDFGCEKCSAHGTSFPEQYLFLFLKQIFIDIENRNKTHGIELDMFIPSKGIAIEYNGFYYHREGSNQEKTDKKKVEICREKGIKLLVIEEHRDTNKEIIFEEDVCRWNYSRKAEDLLKLSNCILNHIYQCIDETMPEGKINSNNIYRLARRYTFEINPINSLATMYPELAEEWCYELNDMLSPHNISYGNKDYFYWQCRFCDNIWMATVNARTTSYKRTGSNKGCPNCASKIGASKWRKKRTELHSFYDWCRENNRQDIIESFDYDNNEGRTLEYYPSGSNSSVNWKCNTCGYRWSATISNRKQSKIGNGCIKCFNKKRGNKIQQARLKKGSNDLLTWCLEHGKEDLISEWDSIKNEKQMAEYTYGSKTRVHWKCNKCGQEWMAQIKSRTLGNSGHRYCKGVYSI